jgi:hypothetical protein
VLDKDGGDQLNQLCKKWRIIKYSQGGQKYQKKDENRAD